MMHFTDIDLARATKAGLFRKVWPEIRKLLNEEGYTREGCQAKLKEHGLDLTLKTFNNYVARMRSEDIEGRVHPSVGIENRADEVKSPEIPPREDESEVVVERPNLMSDVPSIPFDKIGTMLVTDDEVAKLERHGRELARQKRKGVTK